MQCVVVFLLIYVLCSILLFDCVWTSCNILAFRAEMNPFERSFGLYALCMIQSLTFSHCTRYRSFKFNTGLLNISDQFLLKIKNFSVNNASIISLLDLLEYRRLPSLESLQGLQAFTTINSRMFTVKAPLRLKTFLNMAITPCSCLQMMEH